MLNYRLSAAAAGIRETIATQGFAEVAIDLLDALHPQTILAYGMNGKLRTAVNRMRTEGLDAGNFSKLFGPYSSQVEQRNQAAESSSGWSTRAGSRAAFRR